MPCATIHLFLADRVYETWQRNPREAPFRPDREDARDAFLHGALAPDMGFVPGVDRFLSDLSHYHSTGDLARTLLRTAATEQEIAFAWGWVTHVLGDVALHPLVGRACGEFLHGDRQRRLNASEDLPTHVGMEVGLDIAFLMRERPISPPPASPAFTERGIHHLITALDETYGISWDAERVLGIHRRAVRLTAHWPGALRRMARGSRVTRAATGAFRRLAPAGSALAGFFRPLEPPAWIIEEVQAYARELPARVHAHLRAGLAGLENMNLETGMNEVECAEHPGQASVRQRLMERRLRGTAY